MLSPLTLESVGERPGRRSSLLRDEPRSTTSTTTTTCVRSLPQTLLDWLLVAPYLFIAVTTGLAGLLVSLVAIVLRWEPRVARDDEYRARPQPRRHRRPRPVLTESPLASPSSSPPFGPAITGSSPSMALTFRPRARRASVKSSHSFRVELERVSEDEGELTVTPGRTGDDALESVPALMLDGGSSEASSEVDTLPDAHTLEGRYRGLQGWGKSPPAPFDPAVLPRRTYSERIFSVPAALSSPTSSPSIAPPALPPPERPPPEKRRRAFLRPFRVRLSPTPSTPSPGSSSPNSSRDSSPYSTPASSSTNLAIAVGSYFSTVPGDRR